MSLTVCLYVCVCVSVCVCLCVCVFTVGIRGVFEISGVAGLSAERRQKVYRPEVCVKCRYIVLFNSSVLINIMLYILLLI